MALVRGGSSLGKAILINVRYKKIGYYIDVLRQTACLTVNPIKVNSFADLFNCTTVVRDSD